MYMSVSVCNPDFFNDSTSLQDIFFDDVEVDSYASLIKESTFKSVSISIVSGALVFHRYMTSNIPLFSDLNQLHVRHQITIDEHLWHAYLQHYHMDYQPGDEILKLTDNPSTLQDCGIGPFHMTQVCRNGTISIQHISHFVEHINICQVKPYWHRLSSWS